MSKIKCASCEDDQVVREACLRPARTVNHSLKPFEVTGIMPKLNDEDGESIVASAAVAVIVGEMGKGMTVGFDVRTHIDGQNAPKAI
jgi:hypothetical protein